MFVMQARRINREDLPLTLREISSPPRFLDIAGAALPSHDEYKYLCVVGARHHSPYGKDACAALVSGLKGFPIVIVSGLAIGIDSLAHRHALAVGLRVVAFPGSGLGDEVLYPPSRLYLANEIVASGNTVASPFDFAQSATKWTFPVRNRIMAAISHATLVIEGKGKSGTLLTANNAVEFGRDVMVVPGSIFSPLSDGPRKLFKDGATPIFCAADILEALGFDASAAVAQVEAVATASVAALSPLLLSIIKRLRVSPQTMSELSDALKLSPQDLAIAITELEIKGLVTQIEDVFSIKRS